MTDSSRELLGIDPNYQLHPQVGRGNEEALIIGARIFCMLAREKVLEIDVTPPEFEGETLSTDAVALPVTYIDTGDMRIGPERFVSMDQLPRMTDEEGSSFLRPLKDGFHMLVSERDDDSKDTTTEQYQFVYQSLNPIEGEIFVGEGMSDEHKITDDQLAKLTRFLKEYERYVLVLWLEDSFAEFPYIHTMFNVPHQEAEA